MDRGCRGIKRLLYFPNLEGGLRPELGWGPAAERGGLGIDS